MNKANLRLISNLAIKLTADQLKFMRERVAEPERRWAGCRDDLIALRERIYADFTLLRSSQMFALSIPQWKDFLDRRWHQFASQEFTMNPVGDSLWVDFWKNRTKAHVMLFHTTLPPFCDAAVRTTKQKLRILATQAEKSDKVMKRGRVGGCGLFPCFFCPCTILICGVHS